MSEKIKSMKMISDWLENYGWKVYYNQKNDEGRPTFHANTNSKPDLLIRKDGVNILVEVKKGNKHQDILNGFQQTMEYAGEYYIGRAKYKTKKEKNLTINAFVLATQYSLSGFLYNDEKQTDWMNNQYLEKEWNIVEKPITHSVTRLMWREWKEGVYSDFYNIQRANRQAEGIKCPRKEPKVGSLISRVDKKYRITEEPYLLLNSNKFSDLTQSGDIYPFN